MFLGAGAGLFSPRGMKFLHTTPGMYATYLTTIGPGSIITLASFIFVMLNRRKIFSNPITRAMYVFFSEGTFACFSSEIEHYKKQTRLVEHQVHHTPSGSPEKEKPYEYEGCSP